jgi:hypothetical protein
LKLDSAEIDAQAQRISKPELVTLALGERGGANQAVDTEDVAIRAHQLAPTAFAWRRYPEQINLEWVRVALNDAKLAGLAQGKGRAGWVLTDRGVAWLRKNREHLLEALGQSAESGGAIVKRPESQHAERERIRIARTSAWRKWAAGEEVGPAEASAVFRVDQYTLLNNRIMKVRALRELFEGDSELDRFLSEMAEQVPLTTTGEDAGT